MQLKVSPEGRIAFRGYMPGYAEYTGNTLATDGNWHMLTWVNDANRKLDLYVDGKYETGGFDSVTVADGSYDSIGYYGGDGTFFKGSMDDVRIYNRALSAEEVKRLYQLGATTKIAQTLTTNPTLETGLVGHWTFDGPDTQWANGVAATSTDRSGNSNDGTIVGATPAKGVIGQGIKFDDNVTADNYIVIKDANEFNVGTGDHAVALWMKTNGYVLQGSMHNCMLNRGSGVIDEVGIRTYMLCIGESQRVIFGVRSSTTAQEATSTSLLNDDSWHHVVGQRSNNTMMIYVDGVLENVSDAVVFNVNHADTDFFIGTGGAGGFAINRSFLGALDDVRIYNRALSADEVRRLYELGR
jgi:hypothetical protein